VNTASVVDDRHPAANFVEVTIVLSYQKPWGQLWIIPGPTYGVSITIFKRPNWFHRLMARLLLGWVFEEDKK